MLNSPPYSDVIDTMVLLSALTFNGLVLEAEWWALAVAVGGSFSGAVILEYFRRDIHRGEQLFKVIASAIGGLVLGTVLQKYLVIDAYEYRLGLFFICSMLALIILRSLLSLTENNVAEMMRTVLQRVFNLQLKQDRTRRRVRRLEQKIDEDGN